MAVIFGSAHSRQLHAAQEQIRFHALQLMIVQAGLHKMQAAKPLQTFAGWRFNNNHAMNRSAASLRLAGFTLGNIDCR